MRRVVTKRDAKPDSTPPAVGELKLSLEDTVAQKMRGVPVKSRSGVAGYNPYDTVPAAKPNNADDQHKPTDLRKLSQWIRLTREVAELNADKPKKKD
ncbi:MAG: hypothetical protein ACHQDD_06420 [Steroidobacterales bacterium]